MPTLPAALAAGAERWFGHPATVTGVEPLAPSLRRVTLHGEALRGRRYQPGQEVEFRVAAQHLRHYTPARYDTVDGSLDVIFCTHAPGPGSAWAAALQPGQPVAVLGPGGGIRRRAGTRPVLLGDATTIGLFIALLTADPSSVEPVGAVEVAATNRAAAAALLPTLDIVTALDTPGAALRQWLADHTTLPADHAYLAGHAQSIQELRTTLRNRGIPRTAVSTKAHWAAGRTGL
jgi:NADPH-dependent ferric siderophore reductase